MSGSQVDTYVTGTGALSVNAGRLHGALLGTGLRRVRLTELWQLLTVCDPASAAQPDRRAILAGILTELTAAGYLQPSVAVDTAAPPALPRTVTLLGDPAKRSGAEAGRTVAWRPELGWAAQARLSATQVQALKEVNVWLRDRGDDTDIAPLRERSLEIFGWEKQLDTLVGTALFGPDRLSLSVLRTFRAHPPLPARRVGTGPVLLVVENSDTFTTLHSALSERPGQVGWVAWGAGKAFIASVAAVADLPGISEVRYFGDLDLAGLEIPAAAGVVADTAGLPPVQPALGLYEALLSTGVRQAGEGRVSAMLAPQVVEWLPELVRTDVAKLLQDGCRVPQEALRRMVMDGQPGWRTGLD